MTKIFYIGMGLVLLAATSLVIILIIATFSALGIIPGMFVTVLFGGMAIAFWALLIEMFRFELGY